ncbi:MAG: hypothetical protein K2W96_04415, partial [Gemmataceae bacterium]|nr:hypothetical protein [Gemmataceae bacterium]
MEERSVEQGLRDILEPLDAHLDWANTLLAAALVGIVPAVFLLLWLVLEFSGKHALGWAAASFLAVVLAGIAWDWTLSRLARWRFDWRFPRGSTEREAALRMLAEMESPSKAEERLRDSLSRGSIRRVVRRPSPALPAADAVPAIDPVPP